MKNILISIKPRFVAKILNGEKTIEIRKRFPKDYHGWVYIYCTKEDNLCCIRKIHRDRYICGKDFDINDFPTLSSGYEGSGKVVARFWCDNVDMDYEHWQEEVLALSCLTKDELYNYAGWGDVYCIHISKLEIFDKPHELNEFVVRRNDCPFPCNICHVPYCQLKKAPQSWQYIEL